MAERKEYKVQLTTECHEGDKTHRFNLHYYVFKDEDSYIAYCPALDITTSGTDFNDAVAQFYENFQLYIECCLEDGTLIEDLLDHGWKLQGAQLIQPSFDELLRKQEFRCLLDSDKEFDKLNAPLRLQTVPS